ncbi:sigma-70 family RNA polymerase sigma factor [Heliobacterium chlorum]|uniref:Sigma-70 family RNA polymerase sigma factor n=1 Tax=Heliobacterium chlorum TaxID=2698 RepID=A0ABR7T3R3_HELCL|nr:sigma-70 family RNA polymerase sigma factor [Heliobacterium chlorum]MBC9784494.1 sigma-70 family RNA polymerase sigma factor [Heliobacterium chlorum]
MEERTLSELKDLILAAQSGDRQAFSQLVELYQSRVYGLAVHLTGNLEDANDLAQEAFIRAYRYIGSFRHESEFTTWLHRITVNTWINMSRKSRGVVVESLDQDWNDDTKVKREVAATTGDPLEEFENSEFKSMVRSALKEMTEEHRTVLVMRELYGYSYEEIAEATNTSLGTVKSRINRAKSQFRSTISSLAGKFGIHLPAESKQRG